MTQIQAAINAAAIRNLAETLDRWGLGDPQQRAEHIAAALTADGYQRIERPPNMRGPGATRATIDATLEHTRAAIAAAKAARTDTEATQ